VVVVNIRGNRSQFHFLKGKNGHLSQMRCLHTSFLAALAADGATASKLVFRSLQPDSPCTIQSIESGLNSSCLMHVQGAELATKEWVRQEMASLEASMEEMRVQIHAEVQTLYSSSPTQTPTPSPTTNPTTDPTLYPTKAPTFNQCSWTSVKSNHACGGDSSRGTQYAITGDISNPLQGRTEYESPSPALFTPEQLAAYPECEDMDHYNKNFYWCKFSRLPYCQLSHNSFARICSCASLAGRGRLRPDS
jgi:hypothetical protein